MTVGKQVTFLSDPFHPFQSTVAVVIKLLIHRRALADFHQSDVGNQKFQFIFCQLIHLLVQRRCPFKVHLHIQPETQVVSRFGFPRFIEVHLHIGLAGKETRRIKLTVAIGVGGTVQRVNQPHFLCGHHIRAGKESRKSHR